MSEKRINFQGLPSCDLYQDTHTHTPQQKQKSQTNKQPSQGHLSFPLPSAIFHLCPGTSAAAREGPGGKVTELQGRGSAAHSGLLSAQGSQAIPEGLTQCCVNLGRPQAEFLTCPWALTQPGPE